MVIGFIGLGNLGSKLAGSLLRNQYPLVVHDLTPAAAEKLLDAGAQWAPSPADVAATADVIITCLPSPAISAYVLEGDHGVISGLSENKLWLEMSTTEESEVRRLGAKVAQAGGKPLEAPVSGGCHRAATGNISIFVGGERDAFLQVFPVLQCMGRSILHAGPLGAASTLKVITNYLASANLAALAEAWAVARKSGMDLDTTYEAIKASSGNSFVHETESQVILNGSYDINFTLDLVLKDLGLFASLAERAGIPVGVSDSVAARFSEAERRYGGRAWSPRIAQLMEDDHDFDLRALGYPPLLIDEEPETPGHEIGSRLV